MELSDLASEIRLTTPASKIFCFDTETTGLSLDAEIVQLAIVDYNETIVFNELIKPMNPIPREASLIHGITNERVEHCKHFGYWWPYLSNKFFTEKIVIGYNVNYDVRMIFQSMGRAYDPNKIFLNTLVIIDVMLLFSAARGIKSWTSLGKACEIMKIAKPDGYDWHDAKTDAIMTMKMFKKLTKYTVEME